MNVSIPYSPQLLQSVLDSSPNAILALEPAGPDEFTITLANQAAGKLAQQDPASLLSRSFRQCYPFLHQPTVLGRLNQARFTGQPTEFELAVSQTKPTASLGSVQWLCLTVAPLNESVVLTIDDITAKKQVYIEQQRAAEQAELFRAIVDSSPVALMVFNAVRAPDTSEIFDFEWTICNQKTADVIGRPVEDLLGRRLLLVQPHNKPSGLFDRYVRVVETGEPTHVELPYREDGVDGWYDITAIKHNDGLILTAVDTTARKEAELELSRRTEQLQTTLDASLNSIISMTAIRDGKPVDGFPQGRIIDFWMNTANEAVIQSLGRMPDEIIGTRLLDTFPGNVESGLFDVYARVTDTGQPERAIQHYTDEKGLDGWFEVQAVKQGTDGVVLTFMNVTENKRYELQLQRSNESLQQFAYVASHDLQEPLRKITSFGDLLTRRYADSLGPAGSDLIDRMRSAADRMQVLIRDLLVFSRLTIEPPSLQFLDLNAVLAGVLSDLETIIAQKNADLYIDSLPMVQGDALQLRQLFQNLISNALKFVQPGVHPRIQIRSRRVTGKDLPAGLVGRYEVIEIADNGIGFDEQYRDRIFGAFQRLHNRAEYEGTGIGLAIVKRVVELHKGHITAESTPGKGSTFTVYLPV